MVVMQALERQGDFSFQHHAGTSAIEQAAGEVGVIGTQTQLDI